MNNVEEEECDENIGNIENIEHIECIENIDNMENMEKDEDASSECSNTSGNVRTPKRKFREAWKDTFPWLTERDGLSYCTACQKHLINHFTHLKAHQSKRNHLQNMDNPKPEPLEKEFDTSPKKAKRIRKKVPVQSKISPKRTRVSVPTETRTMVAKKYNTLLITSPKPFVKHVEFNRPDNYNAFNKEMWREIKNCFDDLAVDPDCRSIVVSGVGKHFCSGIELTDLLHMSKSFAKIEDVARKAVIIDRLIRQYQDSITAVELCPKPVVCAVHSACVGAGLDFITAADIRYCSNDAFFEVKEVDVGLAADVGTLQRLPKVVRSQSLIRELCFTARRLKSEEALSCGLISSKFPDRETTISKAIELAATIASKSPIAVQATKANLVYSLSRPNQDGLDHVRELNKINLQSEDVVTGTKAIFTKTNPVYSKL